MQNPRTRAIPNKEKQPFPVNFVSESGKVVFTGDDVLPGQNFYFSREAQLGHRPMGQHVSNFLRHWVFSGE